MCAPLDQLLPLVLSARLRGAYRQGPPQGPTMGPTMGPPQVSQLLVASIRFGYLYTRYSR